jgi:ubiquinone/menaquinone biosynthesis C-methylase UbiE
MNDNWRKKIIYRGLLVAYRLLYHQLAWAYDLVAATVSLGHWCDWVRTVIPHLPGRRILELGFGPGHLQRWLTERGVDIFGIDASPQMIRSTNTRLMKQNLSPKLVNAYAQELPYADASFDQVVATFPSDTIIDEPSLRETWRVLVPGGKLVVLPMAWIIGKKLLEKFTAGVFRATGQTYLWDDRLLKRFSKLGFEARAEQITQKSWTLVIIVARKPSS